MKLLKFDTIHPREYLIQKQKNNVEKIKLLSQHNYLKWLLSLRSNYSDFYTYNLNNLGWESEEFVVNDPIYIEKIAFTMYGRKSTWIKMVCKLRGKIFRNQTFWKEKVITDYIEYYQPHVIFVREHSTLRSAFWSKFKKNILIVGMLASPMPINWHPQDFDLLFTSSDTFKDFFEASGTPSYIIHNGFDPRILDEIEDSSFEYPVTFIGGLGSSAFEQRTSLMECIAQHTDFKWWGYGIGNIAEDSPLKKKWQGITSGLEMFQIYKNSKIVINDYIREAKGIARNQRLYEVLGVGSLLLTRDAPNIKEDFPDNIFVTYTDEKDCLDKIDYYLTHEKEREEIANAGQKYVLENFSYKKSSDEMASIFENFHANKFQY